MNLTRGFTALALMALLATATPAWAQVSLGGDGGLIDLDLGGTGANPDTNTETNAVIDLGGASETSTVYVNTGDDGNDAVIHLFGDGGSGATSIGSGTPGVNGQDGDAVITLFGGGAGGEGGPGGPGGTAANGGTGGNGTGVFGPGGSGGNGTNLPANRVAAVGNADACFTPNAQQMDYLLSRTRASVIAAQSSQGRSADLIPVKLCPEARARLEAAAAANPDMRRLHVAVGGNPVISSKLVDGGYGADDVLAVERNQANLTVYVY